MERCSYGYSYITLTEAQELVGKGWGELVKTCFDICYQYEVDIHQIKEKLGGLRFYVGPAPEIVHTIISNAEQASYHVCEVCGEQGELVSFKGWLMTRCERHIPSS